MTTRSAVAIVVGVCLAVAVLFAAAYRRRPASTAQPLTVVQIGGLRGPSVPVAADLPALDEWQAAAPHHVYLNGRVAGGDDGDPEARLNLRLLHRITVVPGGQRAGLLSDDGRFACVRVLDGPAVGVTGWVHHGSLAPVGYDARMDAARQQSEAFGRAGLPPQSY